jgi:hypothetical protein
MVYINGIKFNVTEQEASLEFDFTKTTQVYWKKMANINVLFIKAMKL